MAGKLLVLAMLLFLLTACRQEQLSLPVAHAASERHRAEIPSPPKEIVLPVAGKSCYSYIHLRPSSQRATAVQARLDKADQLAAAFDTANVTVDLLGDHANILSLEFPVVWPAEPAYSQRISLIVEDYLTTPDVEDYMCNSGFSEVQLAARGLNDNLLHPLWTARITTEGLLKVAPSGVATLQVR